LCRCRPHPYKPMPLTDKQREAIVAETQTWIGTPYRGWSCLKKYGVDCGQLLYGVYRACNLVPVLELPKDYSLQIASHRASTAYIDLVAQFFDEITEAEVKPGDIVCYKIGLAFTHAAIVIKWPELVIHAEARHGVSGEHGARMRLVVRRQDKRFFTLKEMYCNEPISS
jgi:cell wall-associated NlpC family hydrolase